MVSHQLWNTFNNVKSTFDDSIDDNMEDIDHHITNMSDIITNNKTDNITNNKTHNIKPNNSFISNIYDKKNDKCFVNKTILKKDFVLN